MSVQTLQLRNGVSGRHSGFTLIEVMITIAIIAIGAAIALPSFREFNIRMHVSDTTNGLIHALNLARSEAVKRGADVEVEAIGGSWSNGWEIKVVSSAEVLDSHDVIGADYTVLGKSTGGGADTAVVFRSAGGLSGATSFDFSVCRPTSSPGDDQSRWIKVAISGIIVAVRDTTSSPAGVCS